MLGALYGQFWKIEYPGEPGLPSGVGFTNVGRLRRIVLDHIVPDETLGKWVVHDLIGEDESDYKHGDGGFTVLADGSGWCTNNCKLVAILGMSRKANNTSEKMGALYAEQA